MYKAIGFDLGGVVIYYSIPDSLRYISQKLEVPLDKLSAVFHELRPLVDVGTIDNAEFWRRLIEQSGSSADPIATAHLWTDNYLEGNPLIQGMLELVENLKKAGYKVGILSNIDPEHAKINYGRGIFEHFDTVLLSDEIHARKPEAEAFDELCRRLGVSLSELVFIDDTPENVSGASKLGVTAIQFNGYHDLLERLKELGIKL